MIQNYNLHTHSIYSDGRSQLSEHVEEAIRQGLAVVGFSEHGPLPFTNTFSVTDMEGYVGEVARLKEEFNGRIDIRCALEEDFIPGVSEPFSEMKERYHLDYLIGGVHLIGHLASIEELWFIDGGKCEVYDAGLEKFFGGDIRKAVRSFFDQTNEMIEKEQFDIIAHFDKIKMHNRDRYFHEDEIWYRKLAMETLDLIREKGLIIEVNTRGIYKKRYNGYYPSPWLLTEAHKMGVPAIISSDAHHYSELTLEFEGAAQALLQAGYQQEGSLWGGLKCWG